MPSSSCQDTSRGPSGCPLEPAIRSGTWEEQGSVMKDEVEHGSVVQDGEEHGSIMQYGEEHGSVV